MVPKFVPLPQHFYGIRKAIGNLSGQTLFCHRGE
jgi:hypothetical protein